MANFKCSFDLDGNKELVSIEPAKFTINENQNIINIKHVNLGQININEIRQTTLDEEFKNDNFNKMSILELSDVKYSGDLSFKIKVI